MEQTYVIENCKSFNARDILSVDNVSGGMCKKKEVTQEYLERMY